MVSFVVIVASQVIIVILFSLVVDDGMLAQSASVIGGVKWPVTLYLGAKKYLKPGYSPAIATSFVIDFRL